MKLLDKISNKIINILNPIAKLIGLPTDKLAHFIAGMIIQIVFSILINPLIALITTTIIAILKELYDNYDKNHVADVLDAIYTMLGGTVIFVLNILIRGVK